VLVATLSRETLTHWPGEAGGLAAQVCASSRARDVVVEVIELRALA
jgi:hypothetical protein